MQEFVTIGDLVTFVTLGFVAIGLFLNWRKGEKKTKNGNDIAKIINGQLNDLKQGQKNTRDDLHGEIQEVKKELKETKMSVDAVHVNCAKTVASFTEQLKSLNKKVNL